MHGMGQYLKQPRQLFQLVVLLLTLAIGVQFYIYVRQASGTGAITVARPPGVEGFLPIGALMGWKQFVLTGQWDWVHPAAMVILGWAVALSLLLRKSFCGWFCPLGTLSEACWRLGQRLLGRNWHPPVWLDMPLRSLKYLLLGFFVWIIFTMSLEQIAAFMHSPYYKLSDVKMLHFFTRMSALTAVVLVLLLAFSLITKNFWCRFLCPYGALLGLFAMAGPTRIRRSVRRCIGCGACDRACPSRLPVSKKAMIQSPECIGCMDCVVVCPVEETLVLSSAGIHRRYWSPAKAGLFIVLFFVLTVYLASVSGHWRGAVSDEEFRVRLEQIDAPDNTHPSVDLGRAPE
ncbi:MAG: 4Fe-4S binding protein [Desulfatitalea sp.]